MITLRSKCSSCDHLGVFRQESYSAFASGIGILLPAGSFGELGQLKIHKHSHQNPSCQLPLFSYDTPKFDIGHYTLSELLCHMQS